MLQKIIHRLLLRRHFWRYATFSEIAELYASRMFRMMAINLATTLISIYLYQIGYSILFIAGYWTLYYFLKIFMAIPAAKYAAWVGPKHGTLLSNLLYIPAIISVTLVPHWGLAALAFTAITQGLSATLYNLCYNIDFSIVKSVEHAGKEIAYMNIIEKFAKAISPLLGGLLAFLAGPQATMWAAAVLFGCASWPLLRTAEPTQLRKRISYKAFPWKLTMRSIIANGSVGFDVVASGTVWSLLVGIFLLGVTSSNQVYVELGALLSIATLAAFAASYAYGQLIDKRRGGELLRITVLGNALVHAIRPFVTTTGAIAATNVANEAATTGYTMAFTRGVFDTADISGRRIAYLGLVEAMLNIGGACAGLVLCVLVTLWGDLQGLKLFFFVAALVVLLIATPKFRLYQK